MRPIYMDLGGQSTRLLEAPVTEPGPGLGPVRAAGLISMFPFLKTP
jgi:hypothetical protein